MTQDDIIRMAREAGVYTDSDDGETFLAMPETSFERFAALVATHERERLENSQKSKSLKEIVERMELAIRADEREACAKVCDAEVEYYKSDDLHFAVERAAAAIRARGN